MVLAGVAPEGRVVEALEVTTHRIGLGTHGKVWNLGTFPTTESHSPSKTEDNSVSTNSPPRSGVGPRVTGNDETPSSASGRPPR